MVNKKYSNAFGLALVGVILTLVVDQVLGDVTFNDSTLGSIMDYIAWVMAAAVIVGVVARAM